MSIEATGGLQNRNGVYAMPPPIWSSFDIEAVTGMQPGNFETQFNQLVRNFEEERREQSRFREEVSGYFTRVNAHDTAISAIQDTLNGGLGYSGLKSRLESVEKSRDEAEKRIAEKRGTELAWRICIVGGILAACSPMFVSLVKFLAK